MYLLNILKNKYFPFLFAVPLFFSVNHYEGIIHDAILYVTQYVYSIDPLRFWNDPAFEFGNQDSLGLFSPILGVFLEWFGVSAGAFVFTVLMQFAWIVATVFVVKTLLSLIRQRLWILPMSILLILFFANGVPFSRIYFFDYVSSYACSRSLSIVLGIGALSLMFNQKRWLSLIFVLTGTAIHPITAGWCLPFWMFFFFPKTKLPVLLVSLAFPFTLYLHMGRFDVLPSDWLARPLAFKPEYEDVSRFVLLFAFWGALAKSAVNKGIKKISVSLCFLMAICFYWHLWAGYGEHIFLYQVQPWRVVWLPSIVAIPVATCYLKDVIRNIIKKGMMSTRDLGLALFVISFFGSRNVIVVSIIAALLVVRKVRNLTLIEVVWSFAGFLFAGYLVQQYLTWCLQGFPSFFGFDYMDLYRIRDSFLIFQFVFSVCFVIYFLKKRQFVPMALLVLSVFFSQFMLLPTLSLYISVFPRNNKLRYCGGIALIVLLVLFDGLIDVEARRLSLMEVWPKNFLWMSFASIVSLLLINPPCRISSIWILIWLFVCGTIAVLNYNAHSLDWCKKEAGLDQYLHGSIFSYVKERGKMLFLVSGEYETEPRLRFLTGSYLSRSSLVGSVFNKGHYRMALERSHLIYQKKLNSELDKFFVYSSIVQKVSDKDTLIDRVSFLCGVNEINYLVTDRTPLPFAKEDSTMINDKQKVFLYGCPR